MIRFQKGMRVRLKPASQHLVQPEHKNRIGTVKNTPRDYPPKSIAVVWDGHKQSSERRYHWSALEEAK